MSRPNQTNPKKRSLHQAELNVEEPIAKRRVTEDDVRHSAHSLNNELPGAHAANPSEKAVHHVQVYELTENGFSFIAATRFSLDAPRRLELPSPRPLHVRLLNPPIEAVVARAQINHEASIVVQGLCREETALKEWKLSSYCIAGQTDAIRAIERAVDWIQLDAQLGDDERIVINSVVQALRIVKVDENNSDARMFLQYVQSSCTEHDMALLGEKRTQIDDMISDFQPKRRIVNVDQFLEMTDTDSLQHPTGMEIDVLATRDPREKAKEKLKKKLTPNDEDNFVVTREIAPVHGRNPQMKRLSEGHHAVTQRALRDGQSTVREGFDVHKRIAKGPFSYGFQSFNRILRGHVSNRVAPQ